MSCCLLAALFVKCSYVLYALYAVYALYVLPFTSAAAAATGVSDHGPRVGLHVWHECSRLELGKEGIPRRGVCVCVFVCVGGGGGDDGLIASSAKGTAARFDTIVSETPEVADAER